MIDNKVQIAKNVLEWLAENIYKIFTQLSVLVLFHGSLLFCQTIDHQTATHKIDSLLNSENPISAISFADSLLIVSSQNNFSKELEIKKIECFHRNELFTEFFLFSDKIASKYKNDSLSLGRIKTERALAYELLGEMPKCFNELARADKLLQNYQKTKYYANLMIRFSSYYRLSGNKEKGKEYAKTSNVLAKKYDYKEEYAVSSLLLSFFCNENEQNLQIFYIQEAIKYFKKINNVKGESAMYYALGKIALGNKDYAHALQYSDSSLMVLDGRLDEFIAINYQIKSQIYEKLNQKDSVIHYLRKYIIENDNNNIFEQQRKLKKLEYETVNQLQKKDLQAQTVWNQQLNKNNQMLIFIVVSLILSITIIVYLLYRIYQSNAIIKLKNQFLQKNNIEIKKSSDYSQLLVRELQHRTKNNLALVLSLIDFQALASESKELKQNLFALKSRISAIATAHALLFTNFSQETSSDTIKIHEYLQNLLDSIFALEPRKIALTFDVEPIELNSDTCIPIGILINELISNTLKHVHKEELKIILNLYLQDKKIFIQYRDNGDTFDSDKQNLGSMIIQSMVKQLKGHIKRENSTYNITLLVKN